MKNFSYDQERLENVNCNLCGADDFSVLAERSANNLKVQTCLCRRCGLIYINPRMTKAGYDNYYKYFYRADRQSIKEDGGGDNLDLNYEHGRRFGRAIGRRLRGVLKERGATLDVGSSTGGVLCGLQEVFSQLEIYGVEPSIAESAFANRHGITTKTALFEDFMTGEVNDVFANILCVRTLNHLLDPYKFFQWSYAHLKPGGCLILEVKNFRHQARRTGSTAAGVQIDHPYMFTPETLRALVAKAGFRVVYFDVDEYKSKKEAVEQRREGLSIHHIRLAAVKSAVSPPASEVQGRNLLYWKLRWQLSPPFLKLYYWLFYAARLSWLRRGAPFLWRN